MTRALTNTDRSLRRCWHPGARSGDVTGQPHGVMLLVQPWALYGAGGRLLGDLVAAVEAGPW